MALKGKREAGYERESEPRQTPPRYPVVSRGNDYEDTLDTERRLKERRKNGGKKPSMRRRRTAKQRWLIAAGVTLAVLVLMFVAYRLLFVKPELPLGEQQPGQEEDVGDGLQPLVGGERKSEDYYTFLLLGRDTGGGGNCDTMMLVSYDMTNQKMSVMSIPRDTMVNVPWDVKKINSVYNMRGGGDKGIEALKTEISQLVGFKPDYTVIVEWEAVGELVKAIGGVWFDVPQDMKYQDPYQDLVIDVKAGYQLLSGEDAMGVIRWRHDNSGHGYATGDLGRIQTQQAFLKAVISQVLQVKNATKLYSFAKIFEENVTTELSVQNLFWLGKGAVLGGLSIDSVNFFTMPNRAAGAWSRSYGAKLSYVTPIASELLKLVNENLSPFKTPSLMNQLDIMSVNSDGSLSSTTGRVEDTPAATAPVIPSDAPSEPITEPEDPGLTDPSIGIDPSNPGTTDPGVTDPGTTDPGTTDPGTTDPGTTDPGTTDPGVIDPGAGGENLVDDGSWF